MKAYTFLYILLAAFFAISCATSDSATQTELRQVDTSSDIVNDDKDYFRDLGDFLRRVPGVNVSGTGNNQRVTIRGISSFNSGIEPLFVIDGQIAGTSYMEVNNRVNPRDVDHIRVLKGPDAAIYGVRGGNGVVVITTKRTN